MLSRRFFLTALGATALAPARAFARIKRPRLEAHEWGTFTSVAGGSTSALEWRPLLAQDDLPSFVYRLPGPSKGSIMARVRMETPVIYFHTEKRLEAQVAVDFPQGSITEWYPRAIVPIDGERIEWTLTIDPKGAQDYPREARPSHYYPARETSAAPIQVGEEREKLLFYRGVGKFVPDAPKDAIAFVRRGDRVAMGRTFDEAQTRSIGEVHAHLEEMLVGTGLFRDEAKAMIATWRDDWFEEGRRWFYLHRAEEILPLHIHPKPDVLVRTFVGRTEVLTEEFKASVMKSARQLSDERTREAAAAQLRANRFAQCVLREIDDPNVRLFLAIEAQL